MGRLQIVAVALALIYLILVTNKYAQENGRTIELKTPHAIAEFKKRVEAEYKERHQEQY